MELFIELADTEYTIEKSVKRIAKVVDTNDVRSKVIEVLKLN